MYATPPLLNLTLEGFSGQFQTLVNLFPGNSPVFPLCGFQGRSRYLEKQENFLPMTGIERNIPRASNSQSAQ